MDTLIKDSIRKDIDTSYMQSRNEFRKKVESGEWNKLEETLKISDEEFQFIFEENWEEEKRKMIEEAKKKS
jgi:hypothetical protein